MTLVVFPLSDRNKLCLLFKLVHKFIPCPIDTPRRALARASSVSSFQLCQPFAKIYVLFFPLSVKLWNNLPSDVVQIDSSVFFVGCIFY